MSTAKRIALFLDGTWNTRENNTNVWRLKSLCNCNDEQIIYYSKGVGTGLGEKVTGGALGYGTNQEVVDAYEWLMDHYEEGDRLYVFGFSRGAYTARSLAGLISKCGLLRPGSPISVTEFYDRYRQDNKVRTIRELNSPQAKEESFTQQERWMRKYCMAPAIWLLGVWDTVGALGIPVGNIADISSTSYHFLETDLRINIDRAYHALAIDENRKKFAPTLWVKPVGSTYPDRPLAEVEQRWFVGAHANVGGGYVDDILAQRPLQWLMGKAREHGLTFRADVSIDGDILTAPIADSYAEFIHGIFKHLPLRYYRPIGDKPVTGISSDGVTINETIDQSVFDRWRSGVSYRPKNLVDWAARKKVDINSLATSVRADDPTTVVI